MKIFSIIQKLFNKFQTNKNIDFGSYGNIVIKTKDGESCGHFWGDRNKVTPLSLIEDLIKKFDNERIKNNWSEEEYKNKLIYNLKLNDVYEYYIKKKRKEKIIKINNKKKTTFKYNISINKDI